jgi:hypothetical protein
MAVGKRILFVAMRTSQLVERASKQAALTATTIGCIAIRKTFHLSQSLQP